MELLALALAFRVLLSRLGLAADRRVAAMWESTSGWPDVEEQFPQVVEPFIAAAGEMSAQWYEDLAPGLPFDVRVPELSTATILGGAVGWAYSQPDPLPVLQSAASTAVVRASRDTVVSNAVREGTGYARLAEPDACAWCRMLATTPQSNLYRSVETASFGHERCHCTAVPVRKGSTFTPPKYTAGWYDEYRAAATAEGTYDLNVLANRVRRDNYGSVKDAVNARRRELYAERKAAREAE